MLQPRGTLLQASAHLACTKIPDSWHAGHCLDDHSARTKSRSRGPPHGKSWVWHSDLPGAFRPLLQPPGTAGSRASTRTVPGAMSPACRSRRTLCVAACLGALLCVSAQPSASVAASGSGQATASTNGHTISVTGSPGCGATDTLGSNAYAYASGNPIANVVVQWGLGQKYVPLNLCRGSSITFEWNTGNANQLYGLYQLTSATCPASFAEQKLIVTPASSPSTTSQVTVNLAEAGPVSAHPSDCPVCTLSYWPAN